MTAVAAVLHPLGCQSPAQLRDDPVHRGEIGEWARRQGAVKFPERPRRRQVAGLLGLRPFELAAQQRLEAAQRIARDPLATRVLGRQLRLRFGAQPQCPPDPLHVDADHARALLAARESRDRQAREVSHRALGAVGERRRNLDPQLLHFLLGELAVATDRAGPAGRFAEIVFAGGQLDRAEEEAVEDELEDPAVFLALGERRGERLAEARLRAPVDLADRRERVEQLRGADLDALVAELLAELEDRRRQAARAGLVRRHRRARRA